MYRSPLLSLHDLVYPLRQVLHHALHARLRLQTRRSRVGLYSWYRGPCDLLYPYLLFWRPL